MELIGVSPRLALVSRSPANVGPCEQPGCTSLSNEKSCSRQLQYLSLRRRNPSRAAATASRPLALPGLIQQLGKLGCGLLYVGWKVRKLMHLANFDHFVVRTGAPLGPFDRFFLRFHLNHPVAAEYFLGFGERPIGHCGLPS